jgi:hypothetical protein
MKPEKMERSMRGKGRPIYQIKNVQLKKEIHKHLKSFRNTTLCWRRDREY